MPEHLHQEVKKSVFEGLRMETKQKKVPECDGYARGQHLGSLQVRLPARRLVVGGAVLLVQKETPFVKKCPMAFKWGVLTYGVPRAVLIVGCGLGFRVGI